MKIVLAYNFSEKRLAALKMTCAMVKAKCHHLKAEETEFALGWLAGIEGIDKEAVNPEAEEAADIVPAPGADKQEMIFLCGFNRNDLDKLLGAIRMGPLKNVPLKAMLTENNPRWNLKFLLHELVMEDAWFKQNRNPEETMHES